LASQKPFGLGNLSLLVGRRGGRSGEESPESVHTIIFRGVSSILDARKDAIIEWIERRLTYDIQLLLPQGDEAGIDAAQIREISELLYSSVKDVVSKISFMGTNVGVPVMLEPYRLADGRVVFSRSSFASIMDKDMQEAIDKAREEGVEEVRRWVEGILRGGRWMLYYVLSSILGITRAVAYDVGVSLQTEQEQKNLVEQLRHKIDASSLRTTLSQKFHTLTFSVAQEHIDGVTLPGQKGKVIPPTILQQAHTPLYHVYSQIAPQRSDIVDKIRTLSFFVPVYSPISQDVVNKIVDALVRNPKQQVAVDFMQGNWEKLGLGEILWPDDLWIFDFNSVHQPIGVFFPHYFSTVNIPVMRRKDFVYPQRTGETAKHNRVWSIDLEKFWHMVYSVAFTFLCRRTQSFLDTTLAQQASQFQLSEREMKPPQVIVNNKLVSERNIVPLLGLTPTNNPDIVEESKVVWNTVASYIKSIVESGGALPTALQPYGEVIGQNKKVEPFIGGIGVGDFQQVSVEVSWRATLKGGEAASAVSVEAKGQVIVLPPKSPQKLDAIVNLQISVREAEEEQFIKDIEKHLPIEVEIIVPPAPQQIERSVTFTFDSTEEPSKVEEKAENALKECYEELLPAIGVGFQVSKASIISHLLPLQRVWGDASIAAERIKDAVVKFIDKYLTIRRQEKPSSLTFVSDEGIVTKLVEHIVYAPRPKGLEIILKWEVGIRGEGKGATPQKMFTVEGVLTNIKATLSLQSPSYLMVDIVGQNQAKGEHGVVSREFSVRNYVPYPSPPEEIKTLRTNIWHLMLYKFVGENADLVEDAARRVLSGGGKK